MKRSAFRNIISICAICAGPAWAEGDDVPVVAPPAFPEFTFKRISVPKVGSTSRINVQIDPAVQAAALAALATVEIPAEPVDQTGLAVHGYEWFWALVAPEAENAGPANVITALAALRDNTETPRPRLQGLQNIAEAYGLDILKATIGTDVSPALVLAVISVESGGRLDAISNAGASGLMQLIPATAERFGVEDASNGADNIKGGVAYLAWLLEQFDQDPILALAGYNAGEGAVRDNGGVPPYGETRAYIPKVLSAWQVARGLCLTPPELMSDGCVFAVKGS